MPIRRVLWFHYAITQEMIGAAVAAGLLTVHLTPNTIMMPVTSTDGTEDPPGPEHSTEPATSARPVAAYGTGYTRPIVVTNQLQPGASGVSGPIGPTAPVYARQVPPTGYILF